MGTPMFMCSVCVHLNGETISEEWSGVEWSNFSWMLFRTSVSTHKF